MELRPGQELPPYRLDSPLGEGGMGVVWRARDTSLGREAAIKLLPTAFADDPDRLSRFEREARVLASLSHPSIAAIYGLHDHEGTRFLAMEFVPGEDLAERIARGPLPLSDALEIGIEICDALAAAHENAIVHRDLKPANVRLTPEGRVKVLDFGLAKAVDHAPVQSSGSDPSISPTMTSAGTAAGMILGTAAYMSPEQARGRSLDRRTDLWAFGCVLYEMLTGRQAFGGETVSDSLAAVLRGTPDESALPERTPAGVRRLLRRCLIKDARLRLRDAGDAALELREVLERISDPTAADPDAATTGASAGTPRGSRPAVAAALLAAGLVVGALAGFALAGRGDRVRGGASEPVRRLSLDFPDHLRIPRQGLALSYNLALSADGRRVAVIAEDTRVDDPTPDQGRDDLQVWLRELDSSTWRALPGTVGAFGQPWFSEDGQSVVYSSFHPTGEIRRVPAAGGAPPSTVARIDFNWQGDFVPLPGGGLGLIDPSGRTYRLLEAGASEPSESMKLDLPEGITRIRFMRGRALTATRVLAEAIGYDENGWIMGTAVVDLESGAVRMLVPDGSVPSTALDGYLTYARGDTLVAAPFDAASAELLGPERALLSGMRTPGAYLPALYRFEGDVLLHAPGGRIGEARSLGVLEVGAEEMEPWDVRRRPFADSSLPTISRDGSTFAVLATSDRGLDQIWVGDTRRPQLRIGAGFRGADTGSPALSDDGSMLAFTVNGDEERDGLWIGSTADIGAPRRLIASPGAGSRFRPESWSPDGSTLLIAMLQPDGKQLGVVRVPAGTPAGSGPDADDSLVEPVRLDVDGASWTNARFSPDGGHVAAIDHRRAGEVVVARWTGDGLGTGRRVSRDSAFIVEWSADGDAIHYVNADGVHRVPLTLGSSPAPSGPEEIVTPTNLNRRTWRTAALFPDGRLLVLRSGESEGPVDRFDILTHASAEFGTKLAAGR